MVVLRCIFYGVLIYVAPHYSSHSTICNVSGLLFAVAIILSGTIFFYCVRSVVIPAMNYCGSWKVVQFVGFPGGQNYVGEGGSIVLPFQLQKVRVLSSF